MPWRTGHTPYRVYVSEIMLQQTSVARVAGKYPSFLAQFPSFRRLAAASVQEVIGAWKGLGYNRRALALRESAARITTERHGRMPRTAEELMELPGVGRATAAAVIVYTYNIPLAFIETNVRRVFLHTFFPGQNDVPDSLILPLVEKTVDRENPREWYYALMDYGTALASGSPGARGNPNKRSSGYTVQSRFDGSLRQLRGRVLSVMLEKKTATAAEMESAVGTDPRLPEVLARLEREGFIQRTRGRYSFR